MKGYTALININCCWLPKCRLTLVLITIFHHLFLACSSFTTPSCLC